MSYRIMCKRSKCNNVIFGDGVMQEIIDLINSKSKNLDFVREDIVTSHRHCLLENLLAKMCEYRLDNTLSCGVHYKIYDSGKEIMCAKIIYSEHKYSNIEFEVYYRGMPALLYEMYPWDDGDPELISDTLTFFDALRKKSHKFKNFITTFDFDGYFNTPSFLRRRYAVYPLPQARGWSLWARAGERRAMRQVRRLQTKQR